MRLDLNQAFPEALDGSRGPLPKQAQFLRCALDPSVLDKDPLNHRNKYIAYVGGLGSGKTLIGCITVLSWAVTQPGEYLISRQYYPELRDTTMKTFFDVCPPELIIEHRVAENKVRLRSAMGKESIILFRPLEEPDKLRSLNLSGFYIDEANQVTEAAFMMLQGRLRGKGLRKGILTMNPKGHDWVYRWFVKQDHLKTPYMKNLMTLIKAPSTENIHLDPSYIQTMMESWSDDRIQRELMASFDSFEGAVYAEFRRDVHVVRPFKIPKDWTKVIGIDHGYRNPAAWVWGAIDYDGTMWIYREFYEKEWLIEEICKKGKDGSHSAYGRMAHDEKIQCAFIDPSTHATRASDGLSDYDWYTTHLPKDFVLADANNSKTAGIDRVKSLFKLDNRGKPKIQIFSDCHHLIEELANYRYAELPISKQGNADEKEEPVKVNDHACDALRYLVMSQPETVPAKEDIYERVKYNSLEGALFRELEEIRAGGKKRDPFGD